MNADSLGAPIRLTVFAVAFVAMVAVGYLLGRFI